MQACHSDRYVNTAKFWQELILNEQVEKPMCSAAPTGENISALIFRTELSDAARTTTIVVAGLSYGDLNPTAWRRRIDWAE